MLVTAGTGFISFDEFCTLVTKKMQADEDERELKEIFKDEVQVEKKHVQQGGEVSVQELRELAGVLGELMRQDRDGQYNILTLSQCSFQTLEHYM